MKQSRVVNEIALNPERIFCKEAEEGKYVLSANKKGEIIQELHDGVSKKRVQLKFSVLDNDEWIELIEKIEWKDALSRYAVEGKGFRLVRGDGSVVLQSPEDKLGVFVSGEPGLGQEDFATGEFYRHYEFERVAPAPVEAPATEAPDELPDECIPENGCCPIE